MRIGVIDYLRGLASLAVAWFHLTNGYAPDSIVRLSGAYGWAGVDCFFVISGFVIPYFLMKGVDGYTIKHFPRFMGKRLLRLEPTYLVSIVLVIVLAYLSALAPGFRGDDPNFSSGQVLSHLLYLTPVFDQDWIQPVYWTLAYEFVFYIAIGLIFPFIAGERSTLRLLILTAVLWGVIGAGLLDARWALFVIGIALCKAMFDHLDWRLAVSLIGISALLLAADGQAVSGLVGTATALVIWGGRRLQAGAILGSALGGLGAISYSLYLIHVPIGGRVVNLGKRFIDEVAIQEFVLSALALAASITCAFVLYRLVELPSHWWSRRISVASDVDPTASK